MNIIYNSGSDFIKDNYQIISSHQLETIFFVENAKKIQLIDRNNYMIKIYHNASYLLAIHCQNYPLVLFGDLKLVDELILVLNKNKYYFDKILTNKNLGETFLQSYEKLNGGFHAIHLSQLSNIGVSFHDKLFELIDEAHIDNKVQMILL